MIKFSSNVFYNSWSRDPEPNPGFEKPGVELGSATAATPVRMQKLPRH